jgi:hypothetical protein
MPFASVLLASEMGLDFDPEQALATALGHETDPELIEDSSDASQSENTKVARPDSPDGSMSPTGVQTESQVEHPPVPFAGFADTGMMSQIDANLGSDADIVEVRTLGDHPPTITANRPVGHMMDASLTDRRLVSQSAFPVSAGSTGPLQTRPERPPAQMLHLTRSAPEATVSAAISDPSEGAPAPTKPVQQPTKVQISQSLVPFVPLADRAIPDERAGALDVPRASASHAILPETMAATTRGPNGTPQAGEGPTTTTSGAPTAIAATALSPQSDILTEFGLGATSASDVRPVSGEPIIAASSPPVARQIFQQIGMAITQTGNGTTEITFNPEELGRVRLTVSHAESGPTVIITAERPDVLDLMRRHIGSLGLDLAQAGLGQATFTFGEHSQQGPPSDAVPEPSHDESDDLQPFVSPTSVAGSGLDLRL